VEGCGVALEKDVGALMFGVVEGLLARAISVVVCRLTQSSGGGGQPEYAASVTESSLQMGIEQLSGGQRERAFGQQSEAIWRGVTYPDADVLENDLVVPASGPYAGIVMEVESKRVSNAGTLMVLGLKRSTKSVS
jgi:hypothetical protein